MRRSQRKAAAERDEARRALHEQIPVVAAWLAHADVPSTRISVVIATRDRAHLLGRAIDSVRAQSHPAVDLVVVDDGSTDATRDLAGDGFRVVHQANRGLVGARNTGLEVATGDIVCYLDDDNVMHRDWLRAVAWAFDHFPGTQVAYGAQIFEDWSHLTPGRPVVTERLYPWLQFQPFDRTTLLAWNFIDANVIAHHRDHPEARFAEGTGGASDWDLALRLTRDTPALAIPAVACNYRTREPSRMTLTTGYDAEVAALREKHRA